MPTTEPRIYPPTLLSPEQIAEREEVRAVMDELYRTGKLEEDIDDTDMLPHDDYFGLCEWLHEVWMRKSEMGLTNAQIAALAGTDEETIHCFSFGGVGNPSYKTLVLLARAVGMRLWMTLEADPPPSAQSS